MAEGMYPADFDEWVAEQGMRAGSKSHCRQCGGEIVGPPRITELPNPDGSDTSAAFVESLCAQGHTVKCFQSSWKFLETLQKMGEENG